jgi:glycosyltransferase involved in cell wall biosynthesis
VVIATRNRAVPLRHTLLSLSRQSRLPDSVVIVDASDDGSSELAVEALRPTLSYPLVFAKAPEPSAARQRNRGTVLLQTDVVVFLDDDVDLDREFLRELVTVLERDLEEGIGGVSGTIANQTYTAPRRLNRALLGLCIGDLSGKYPGRLIGPAVNFLPEDAHDTVRDVEWLPSCCAAYRRSIFLDHGFCEDFEGYSFAEDVHLSSRIHRTHRLVNTTRARLHHGDLGGSTHRDWRGLGESMVVNRHYIMTSVLGRTKWRYQLSLFTFEIIYGSLTFAAASRDWRTTFRLTGLLRGRLSGFWKVWTGKSRHMVKSSKHHEAA